MINHGNEVKLHIDIYKPLETDIDDRLLDLTLVSEYVQKLDGSKLPIRHNYLHLLVCFD